jgi:hypothetical protein
MSEAKRLKMPAGCIDVTREIRDSGAVISLIGDEVWRAFPSKANQSKGRRRPRAFLSDKAIGEGGKRRGTSQSC